MSPVLTPAQTLKQLVLYMTQALVDRPQEVEVTTNEGQHSILIKVSAAPDDVRMVIGKGGQTANALRRIVSSAATKLHKKVLLEIQE